MSNRTGIAIVSMMTLLATVGAHAVRAAAPARLEELDREHLLMLMGGGLETWRMADVEILVGAVPWMVEMFVTVPEDVIVRASRVERRPRRPVAARDRGPGERAARFGPRQR